MRLNIGSGIGTGWIASCILACGLGSAVRAENWPQWRGPNSDGKSTEVSLPTKFSKTEHVAWRSPLPGQGGATPIIWNDRIFVTSADGNDLVLICLSTKDGQQLWKKTVTNGNQDARSGEGNSASPSPSTDGKHVWCFFGTGVLASFDFEGNEKWKFDAGARFGKIDIQFGMTSTPVLHGDSLYLQLIHGPMKRDDNSQTGQIIRLNKLTGETVWVIDRKTQVDFECKHSYASPFVFDDGKQKFLIAHGADCTTGHDLETGKELWRLDQLNGPSTFFDRHDATFRFVSSPAFTKEWIIVPTAKEGPTLALKVNGGLKGNQVAQSDSVGWKQARTPDVSIPLIDGNLVYLLHKDGKLQCLELASGKELYFERTHTSQHRASPFMAGKAIYLCAKDGTITVVEAGPKLQVIAANKMDEPITASPAAADGTLYIRTYEALYAIK